MPSFLNFPWNPTRKLPVCVGTYHKTGTVWMIRVFRDIAEATGMEFVELGKQAEDVPPPQPNTIYFQDHCDFPASFFRHAVRGIRIVRDPRDVVISGTHYHCKSDEPWLHESLELFGGKTYSEMINREETLAERYLFEMDNVAGQTIRSMTNSDGNRNLHRFLKKRFRAVKYEDLVEDTELKAFGKVCKYLRIPLEVAGPCFTRNSLFAGDNEQDAHVRSGKKQQWKTSFSKTTAQEFAKRHQRSLEVLGYERNSKWLRDKA